MNKIVAITIADDEAFLRKISEPVSIAHDKELKGNISSLGKYCKENPVMAMAAVQIGIPKRIIYLSNTDINRINRMQKNVETKEDRNYDEARVLINPIILKREGLTTYWEACASCLDNVGLVKRPYRIFIEYYDEENNKHFEIFEGFEATVLSHEMDHLDGVLHMDVAEKVLVLPLEERKALRQKEGYKIISKVGDYKKLLKD